MRQLALFLLTCLFSISISAYPDSLLAVQQLELANSYAAENNDSSNYYMSQVLAIFEQADDLGSWINAHRKVARTYLLNGNISSNIDLLKKATANILRKPTTQEEWRRVGWAHVNLGYTFKFSLSDFKTAKESYEQAKTTFENKVQLIDLNVAKYVYGELGNIYTRFGDYEAAYLIYEKMKKIALQNASPDYNLAADACSELAIIHLDKGANEAAISCCLEGLAFPNLSVFSQAPLQFNLAKANLALGKDSIAIIVAQEAKIALQKIVDQNLHPRGKPWLASAYSLLANIEEERGQFKAAEVFLKTAWTIQKDYNPDTLRREIAKLHYTFGNLYHRWGKPEKALTHHQMALHCVLPEFKEKNPSKNPNAAIFYPENAIMEGLSGKANVFQTQYDLEKKQEYLQKAIECHELVFDAERVYRRIQHFESSQLDILNESRQQSEKAIEAALQFYHDFGAESYLKKAFTFAEKSKSILLFEALKNSDAKTIANIPDSTLQLENKLYEAIKASENILFFAQQQAEEVPIDSLKNEVLKAKDAYAKAMDNIETDYPEYYRLKYQQDLITLDLVQSTLQADQALIEYFVGDKSIFVFIVKKDVFEVVKIQKEARLEALVMQFRNDIEAFHTGDKTVLCQQYTKQALLLYDQLFRPLETYQLPENLILIPSGILGFLPFDALLTDAPPTPCHFPSYPYLINRHNIVYNYSATLWKELYDRKNANQTKAFLGFAPNFLTNDLHGLDTLKYNMPTVQELYELLGGNGFTGIQATRTNFEKWAANAGILHFATHAKANPEAEHFSFIVLANEHGGYDSLYVNDIYRHQLQAELVFLGACETGFGKLHNGEGIISLARSFLYAGANSVITTLWSVNDQLTKDITLQFYQNLENHMEKDKAIRTAKMAHFTNENNHFLNAHPVYWAAYAPIGNMSPIFSSSKWWYGLTTLCILSSGWFFFRRKNHNN